MVLNGFPFPCWIVLLITQRDRSHTCPLHPTPVFTLY
jgi:hypothetical protein